MNPGIDLTFLKALRDKLKGGNTKSIHLNVLPGRYVSRLDLANLNIIRDNLSETFLEKLFSERSFEFKISFDDIDMGSLNAEEQKKFGLLSKRLNALYFESEDNFKEQGIKTFGFGYPILIKQSKLDPAKIIKAPLLIWQLEIIKSLNKVNTWSVMRNRLKNENGKIVDDDVHAVSLNEVLLAFIRNDENIILPQINEDALEDLVLTRDEVVEECMKALNALNGGATNDQKEKLQTKAVENINTIPVSSELESIMNNKSWIHFGGVFGLFRTQKESIITDLDRIIERVDDFDFEKAQIENFSGTPFSAIDTDPSQQEILSTLGLQPRKIIQGPPGTGKSQSLTALITNAVANNLKCLVVCEKKTALEVIKNNLHKENEQLGALAALIEDVNKDRDGIVTSVRDRLTMLGQTPGFANNNYNTINERIAVITAEINNQHKSLDAKIYRGQGYTELVGEYLKRAKSVNKDKLKKELHFNEFQFKKDEQELIHIVDKIKRAKRLYSEIARNNHPMDVLSDQVFKHDNFQVLKTRLEDILAKLLDDFRDAIDTSTKQTEVYTNWLGRHYSECYNDLKSKIGDYITFVQSHDEEFGDEIYKNGKMSRVTTEILSILINKHRRIKSFRNELMQRTSDIKRLHLKHKYFEHSYVQDPSSLKPSVVGIEKLSQSNETWFANVEQITEKYLQDIYPDKLHPLYNDRAGIVTISQTYKGLFSLIRTEKIFHREVLDQLCIRKNQGEAERIVEEIKQVMECMTEFRDYYNWRTFYVSLSDLEKKIIQSLIKIDEPDWVGVFECWYYFWIISTTADSDLPNNDENIKELVALKEQLKKAQIQSIISKWSKAQMESVSKATASGINPVSLFNKKGSRGERRNSLRKIMRTDFGLFTTFFPVVMTNPSTCSSIIPLEEDLFDVVIFDEASQLRLEDTFPALLRGKIKVVSGDSQQMPPSSYFQGGHAVLDPSEEEESSEESELDLEQQNRNRNDALILADSESLLVYAENCRYKQSYLKIHYRSQHPSLIDFSNHAFYSNRLIPMPAKNSYKPITYVEVNGIYADQGNLDEARQVVDILLNHIKPLPNGKYPTVGIATFNLYQRNLILEEIIKVRQSKPEYDKKISDLGSELFVKNLENIQGDERDVIIISTTFGRKANGSFSQTFGPILQKNGYKLLNVIITRAKYKVFVCTSIPIEFINQYPTLLQHQKNNGRAIFYAYLAYAKAVHDGNEELRQNILSQLHSNSGSFASNVPGDVLGSESPFEEEVYSMLTTAIDQQRIVQQFKIGGFRIDLMIKSRKTGFPVLAIECDGAKYHSSNEAYAWDLFRQKQLEQYGLKFHRIWSTNWFHSTDKEFRRLVDFIAAFDKTEADSSEILQNGFFDDVSITSQQNAFGNSASLT